MSEEPTSFLHRAKEKASEIVENNPKTGKSIAIGTLSGGVSFATLAACYQLFVTNANHRADMSTHWQEIKNGEVRLNHIESNVAKLSTIQRQLDDFIAQQIERNRRQWEVISKKQDKI